MSQRYVECIIGRLVTDEAFRRRFLRDPADALRSAVDSGVELNDCEIRALAAIDPHQALRFAESIDPRIQKADLHGEER